MGKKAKKESLAIGSFSQFLEDPPVAAALVAFALIALFLSIIEFSQALT